MADNFNQSLGTLETHLTCVRDRGFLNRQASIEPKWQRNRANFYRDPTLDAKTWTEAEKDGRTSKTVFDITKNKCMAAVTIIYDMVTQGGRLALMVMPEDRAEAKAEISGSTRPPALLTAGGQPGTPTNPEQANAGADMVSQAAADVQAAVDKQTALVDRQFENCDARLQVLKSLLSGAIYGSFWCKRYVSKIATRGFRRLAPDVYEPFEQDEPAPAFEAKSIWNMFWDIEAATPEQREYVFERSFVSQFEVRQMMKKPYYLDRKLKLVLDKMQSTTRANNTTSGGPGTTLPPAMQAVSERSRTGELIEFWCRAPLKTVLEFEHGLLEDELAALDLPTQSEQMPLPEDEAGNEVYIMAETIDGQLVRYTRVSRDDWPYFDDVWELNLDGPGGIGVADNVEQEQLVLNGAVRALEEVTKILGQLILRKSEYRFQETQDGPFPRSRSRLPQC
ncbi:MAG: hypothetical protein NTY53_24100 [Kiritimatiellaeota bacterium]|nr:hypothetical protein [Kiritimatiellota bacterium]